MFKYEYGQLPDALNMFLLLLRIDMCIITIFELRTAIAKHTHRAFRLVGVHYIYDNINIATSFSSFKKILKKCILSDKIMFYLI